MTIEIRHRITGALLWSGEAATKKEALERAVKAGANLARANLAGADLGGANLARAYLAGAYLAGAYLAGADLAGANLADANLADAYLAGANLAGANLARAYLAGATGLPPHVPLADPPEPYVRPTTPAQILAAQRERARRFRERHPEVPVVEHLDAKILDACQGGALLDMSTWHCGTTHCRAGFATVLAGEAGATLEREHGTQYAATLIYRASTGRVPHFFATKKRALEDLRRCAAFWRPETTR